jgi:ATP-binding cassette subfamily B protein
LLELSGTTALPAIKGKVELRQVSFFYEPIGLYCKTLSFNGTTRGSDCTGRRVWRWEIDISEFDSRFYDPQDGMLLIDDRDIRTVTWKSLRRQIGIVPQETTLFSGTIAENIAFGQINIDFAPS